jgi:NADH-quinone oxidoreductase subunit E
MKGNGLIGLIEKMLRDAERGGGSEAVRSVIERYGRDPSRIIGMLQDIQAGLGYLPREELRFLAGELGIPLSRIYAISTFYRAFNLSPRGRHEIKLCTGTACHVRGAELIKEAIERELSVVDGGTTGDGRYSFETVHCIGCCGLAPAMVVDKEVHPKLKTTTVNKVLEKYK